MKTASETTEIEIDIVIVVVGILTKIQIRFAKP